MDDKIRQLNNQIELLKKSSMGADEMRVDYFLEPGTHQWHCPADCEEVVLTMAAGGCNYDYKENSLDSHLPNILLVMQGGYLFKKRIQIPQNLRNTDIQIQVGKSYCAGSFFNNYIHYNNNYFKAYYLCSELNALPYDTSFNQLIQQHISKINSSFGNLATCTGSYYKRTHTYVNDVASFHYEGIPNAKMYNIRLYHPSDTNNTLLTSIPTSFHNPLSGWTHNGESIPIYCGNGAIGFFSESIPNNAIIPARNARTFPILETKIYTPQSVAVSGHVKTATIFDAQPGCVIVEYK